MLHKVYSMIKNTEHESIILKDDAFEKFVSDCSKGKEPNKALLDAVERTKREGFYDFFTNFNLN